MKTFLKNSIAAVLPTAALLFGASAAFAAPTTWVHPGAANNQADLAFVAGKIATKTDPWASHFNTMMSQTYATASYTRTAAPANTAENDMKADALKALSNALAWAYTGEAKYGTTASKVLTVWASTFTTAFPVPAPGTGAQSQLHAGWIGALMGSAAEILRGYNGGFSGFTATDKAAVKKMFTDKFYPALNQMSTWNGNVDLTQIDAMMQLAVFNEDGVEFDRAISRLNARNLNYYYLASDNITQNASLWFNPSKFVDGLAQESCRWMKPDAPDNGHHMQFATASTMRAAEAAWNQGVDYYGQQQTRYVAAMELLAKMENTGSMQKLCQAGQSDVTSPDLYNTWHIAYRHYNGRKGVAMPQTAAIIASPRAKASDWNVFFENLTHGGLPAGGGSASSAASSVAGSAASSVARSASSSSRSSAPGSAGGNSTCGATTFNKTATVNVDLAASVGDCVRFAHPSGTLQIGSWGGRASSYNITGGAQGVTNAGAAYTSVPSQATGYLYIKIVSGPASYSVKFNYW